MHLGECMSPASRLHSLTPFSFVLVSVALLPGATVVHRPYLQNLRADSVTIMWSARENLAGAVHYSPDQSYSHTAVARVRQFPPTTTGMNFTFYQYRAELTGLSAGTEYLYRVVIGGETVSSDSQSRFQTPGAGPFSFLVLADNGAGTAGQVALALRMVEERPNFLIHAGDIAYQNGTFEEFQAYYFEFYWTLMRRACFFTTPGNHEYIARGAAPYLALHAPPVEGVPPEDQGRYYSFDWSDAHFVALDSNLLGDPVAGARMLEWLESDLGATTARWRIAFFHHTPYPLTHHLNDPVSAAVRARLLPLLERYGVQLVFAGHEHNYVRTKSLRAGSAVNGETGTVYITSGGGGAVLHPVASRDILARAESMFEYLRVQVDSSYLTVRAIGADGREFDRVVLALPSFPPGTPVVNAASFAPPVAPGSLISIFGEGLAGETTQAGSLPLPLSLSGSTVSLNNSPLPLIYASGTQINAQLATDVQGTATLSVITSSGIASTQVQISSMAPAIFSSGIAHANGTAVSSAAPVLPGETLVVYMTGLGRVDGAPPAGHPAPVAPLLRVSAPIEALFSEVSVTPSFAGLTPGLVGVYQVNVDVPLNLASRMHPFRISSGGIPSNSINIPVRER
jgi:uncharacterized protein (TIGR03437 family)